MTPSIVAFAARASAATLADVCTTAYVQASLPTADFVLGVTPNGASVTATAVTGANVTGNNMYPDATFDYCDVEFSYTHNGRGDTVNVRYWLPTPDNFHNRFLATGGGGYAINSGTQSLPGGVIYGAAAGATDGGFGSFDTNLDEIFLLANGTANWESLFMFSYEAIHEMTLLGQELTRNFFGTNDTKLYSYYQGCSEGGREGWSQVQRFADQFDGAITGAPAMRFSFQQVQHMYSNVVEQTLGYFPPPCELEMILNLTITACDPLDGATDGVVARSDLCKLNFDLNSTVGEPYACAARTGSPFPGGPSTSTPAQSGTVTAEGIAVAAQIIDGLHDTDGKRVYFSYQPAASFADAATQFNNVTSEWELSVSDFGAEFVTRFLQMVDLATLPNLDNVTYDTLKDWMIQGWQTYEDTLHTTWPLLDGFQQAGGKILHYHGESDDSIPAASSVRYFESVRSVMYPGMSYNDSIAEMNDWYRLFLVPGAGHCGPNQRQPNGPFPQTNLAVLIDWVENAVEPTTLNATVLQGEYIGENRKICGWPLRPLYSSNSTTPECVYDQISIDSWIYDFDAIKLPVY